MHFKCGTEAKVGDICRFRTASYKGATRAEIMREGVIFNITPGCKSCNAMVAVVHLQELNGAYIVTNFYEHVTLGECEKAEVPIEPGH